MSAWKLASTIFAETPTVDQRCPSRSALSIITRVTASVPPLVIRTRKSTSRMSSMKAWYGPRSFRSARDSALTGPWSAWVTGSWLSETLIARSPRKRTTTTASEALTGSPRASRRRSTVTR